MHLQAVADQHRPPAQPVDQQPYAGRRDSGAKARPPPYRVSIAAVPENLHAVRLTLRDWLFRSGWPDGSVDELIVVVNEAVSHAVECLYLPVSAVGTVDTVEVVGTIEPTTPAEAMLCQARFEITGHGEWNWNVTDIESLLQPSDDALAMMRACSRDFAIRPTSSGTHVTVISHAINRVKPRT